MTQRIFRLSVSKKSAIGGKKRGLRLLMKKKNIEGGDRAGQPPSSRRKILIAGWFVISGRKSEKREGALSTNWDEES